MKTLRSLLRLGALVLLSAAGLSSCGTPTDQADQAVTLPASPAARDSVQAELTTPARDAASTAADSMAARSSATPR